MEDKHVETKDEEVGNVFSNQPGSHWWPIFVCLFLFSLFLPQEDQEGTLDTSSPVGFSLQFVSDHTPGSFRSSLSLWCQRVSMYVLFRTVKTLLEPTIFPLGDCVKSPSTITNCRNFSFVLMVYSHRLSVPFMT